MTFFPRVDLASILFYLQFCPRTLKTTSKTHMQFFWISVKTKWTSHRFFHYWYNVNQCKCCSVFLGNYNARCNESADSNTIVTYIQCQYLKGNPVPACIDRPHFTSSAIDCFLFKIGPVIAGVLKSWFVKPLLEPDYYSNITEETDNEWKKTHGGKNVSETIKDYLVTYVGEPLSQLLRY